MQLNWITWLIGLPSNRKLHLTCSCGMEARVAADVGWVIEFAKIQWYRRHSMPSCDPQVIFE